MEFGKILCVGWVIKSRPDHVQALNSILPCHVPHPYRFSDHENVCRGNKRNIYAHPCPALAIFASYGETNSGHSDNRIEDIVLLALANIETAISPDEECDISAAGPLDRFLDLHAAHLKCSSKKSVSRPPRLTNSSTSLGVA
jgi:hypothetical protein